MTPEETYLFDLNGHLILRGVLPPSLVDELNRELDRLEALSDNEIRASGLTRSYYPDEPDGSTGCRDYSCTLLRYGGVFERLIDWPAVLPYMEAMISVPIRLDALHLLSRCPGRATVFHHGYSELLSYSEFAYNRSRFECVSVKVGYALTDVDAHEGAFAVIPGSHKGNFASPLHLENPDENHPLVQTCPCRAGDAVIFSEDLTHGAVMNRSRKIRRTIFASYAPSFQAAWDDQIETATGFEERATPRRLELVQGPPPFDSAPGFNLSPFRASESG
jgi:hypothetical protein